MSRGLDTSYILDYAIVAPAHGKESLVSAAARLSAARPAWIVAIAGVLEAAVSTKPTLALFRAWGSANTDGRQDGISDRVVGGVSVV